MKVYAIFEGWDDYDGGTDEALCYIVNSEETARASIESWIDAKLNAFAGLRQDIENIKVHRDPPREDDPVQDEYQVWIRDEYIRYEPFEVKEKPLDYTVR